MSNLKSFLGSEMCAGRQDFLRSVSLSLRPAAVNWNNLVLSASWSLFGWQSILLGQSVLLKGDKAI